MSDKPENLSPNFLENGITISEIEKLKKWGEYYAELQLTSSQLRKFYGAVQKIYIELSADGEQGFENQKMNILLLEPKLAYMAGKEKKTGQTRGQDSKGYNPTFGISKSTKVSGLMAFYDQNKEFILKIASKKQFENYFKMLEALIAYHKINEGKDKENG